MSLPGPFLSGQRLTAGQLNDATQKTIDSNEIGAAGSLYTTSGTTQLDIPRLGIANVDFVGGAMYTFDVRLILQNSVSTDEFSLKIRRDTALTGTLVSDWIIYRPNQTAGGYFFVNWDDITFAADDPAVDLFVSLQRVSGSGTLSLFGQLGSTNKTGMALRRSGYSSEFRTTL